MKQNNINYSHKHKIKKRQNTLYKTCMTHPNQLQCGEGSPPTHCLFPECLPQSNHIPEEPRFNA